MPPCMLRRRPVLLYRETAVRVAPRGNTLTLIARIRLSAKASPLYSRLCNVIETRLVLYALLSICLRSQRSFGLTLSYMNFEGRKNAHLYPHLEAVFI